MCCFFSTLWLLGPRLGFLIYWLTPFGRLRTLAAFNSFLLPLLGVIFLPWTTLTYSLIYRPGGLIGLDWLWMALAFVADLSAFAAAATRRRDASWYRGP